MRSSIPTFNSTLTAFWGRLGTLRLSVLQVNCQSCCIELWGQVDWSLSWQWPQNQMPIIWFWGSDGSCQGEEGILSCLFDLWALETADGYQQAKWTAVLAVAEANIWVWIEFSEAMDQEFWRTLRQYCQTVWWFRFHNAENTGPKEETVNKHLKHAKYLLQTVNCEKLVSWRCQQCLPCHRRDRKR